MGQNGLVSFHLQVEQDLLQVDGGDGKRKFYQHQIVFQGQEGSPASRPGVK